MGTRLGLGYCYNELDYIDSLLPKLQYLWGELLLRGKGELMGRGREFADCYNIEDLIPIEFPCSPRPQRLKS